MKVRIFKPSKSTSQSGRAGLAQWVLQYEEETKRGPEPLNGWTASGDTLNQVKLEFQSVEDAVSYAQKNGWDYTVLPPHGRRVVPRNYGDNFKYIPAEKQDGKSA